MFYPVFKTVCQYLPPLTISLFLTERDHQHSYVDAESASQVGGVIQVPCPLLIKLTKPSPHSTRKPSPQTQPSPLDLTYRLAARARPIRPHYFEGETEEDGFSGNRAEEGAVRRRPGLPAAITNIVVSPSVRNLLASTQFCLDWIEFGLRFWPPAESNVPRDLKNRSDLGMAIDL
jgi:hypothetical protein